MAPNTTGYLLISTHFVIIIRVVYLWVYLLGQFTINLFIFLKTNIGHQVRLSSQCWSAASNNFIHLKINTSELHICVYALKYVSVLCVACLLNFSYHI